MGTKVKKNLILVAYQEIRKNRGGWGKGREGRREEEREGERWREAETEGERE